MKSKKERYWKVAPGSHGFVWIEQRDNNCIAIGWDETGDLDNYKTADRIKERFAEVFRREKTRPTQLLKFYEISLGIRFWQIREMRSTELGELLVATNLMIVCITDTPYL
jgi:hypothetical protein